MILTDFEKFTVLGFFLKLQDETLSGIEYLSLGDIEELETILPKSLKEIPPTEAQHRAKDFVARLMEELKESYAAGGEE